MVVMAEILMRTVVEQGMHTVEVLASKRDLGDFSNYGYKCCHMVH